MTTPPRTDLLALTPDTLAAIANRGLVRRATKELDAGANPELRVAPDGGVAARFADGAEASMPPGASLDSGVCGCDAAGVCRHLIGLVLAYQRTADTAPLAEVASDWSPGDIDDAALTAAVGTRALTAARRTARRDATVRVHRPTARQPHPWVELPTCTVRFPVPGQAAHALTDVADPLRGEMLALAVWAFRAADATDRQARLVLVHLRPPDADSAASPQENTNGPGSRQHQTDGHGARDHRADGDDPHHHGADGHGPCQHRADSDDPPLRHTADDDALIHQRQPDGPLRRRSDDAPAQHRPPPTTAAATDRPHAPRSPHAPQEPLQPEHRTAEKPRPHRPTRASPLCRVVELADELLWDGVAHADAVQTAALRTAGRRLTAASLHWPATAAGELADQLDAYTARSAPHRPEKVATLLAELHARHRAADHPEVLGTQESADTPLRKVRLTALGCRVSGSAERPVAEVYFAHAAAGVVLVLRKDWPAAERPGGPPAPGASGPTPPPTAGHTLAARRLAGTTLSALASGNLVSESARRTAGRRLTLPRGRLAATTVSPVGRSWSDLPEPLLVRDVTRLAAAADGRPPRLIRARVEAESVRVVEISDVLEVGYDPAEQVLKATVRDAAGHPLLVRAPHNPLAPAALDTLASALTAGGIAYLSGAVRHCGDQADIAPLALLGPDGVLVPDLAPPTTAPALPLAGRTPPDPIATAVDAALTALADAAHHGLRRLPRSALDRLRDAADRLTRTGLAAASNLLRTLLDTLEPGHNPDRDRHDGHRDDDHAPTYGPTLPDAATTAWTDACIRLHTTADLTTGLSHRPPGHA